MVFLKNSHKVLPAPNFFVQIHTNSKGWTCQYFYQWRYSWQFLATEGLLLATMRLGRSLLLPTVLGTIFRVQGIPPNLEISSFKMKNSNKIEKNVERKIGMVLTITDHIGHCFQGPGQTFKCGYLHKNSRRIRRKIRKEIEVVISIVD